MGLGIGKRIKEKREELGLTQLELAHKMGYKSKAAICKVEKGEDNITSDRVTLFAKALGCSESYIMGWQTNNHAIAVTEPGEALIAFPPHYDLSDADRELLDSYHNASPEDRAIVDLALKRNRQKP